MDLSALIFVALAVAWAAYLIPKALKHHEEDRLGRTVESFSSSLRVLARRDTTDGRTTTLVVPGRPAAEAAEVVEVARAELDVEVTTTPAPRRTASPAQRRRRVLGLLLMATGTVLALAAFAVLAWAWVAAPAALLVAWLVACRVMVKAERRRPARPAAPRADRIPAAPVVEPEAPEAETGAHPAVDDEREAEVAVVEPAADADPETEEIAAVPAAEQGVQVGWDPVPTTLPTYVTKEPAARRSVRTIDLDSTGVWTSGRSEVDSQIAREAEEAARVKKAEAEQAEARAEERRASGS
ncbi:divisome protein SepX/GlpR [Nocardioides nanhaiensis]|uniref:Uncharacterized protein n=1 Tax=Nocardioides nanhaiensis TaxID=1476871 RepID=A0ABP8W9C2_9ACTN